MMGNSIDLSAFAKDMVKEAGLISGVGKAILGKIHKGKRLARIGKRIKNSALRTTVGKKGVFSPGAAGRAGAHVKDSFVGPKGMFGKNVRAIGKGMVTRPYTTMKRGFNRMGGGEKALAGISGTISAQDAVGELNPGETRAGRIGSNLGFMAGLMATPVRRVGMLGNILAADLIGSTVGRQAGRLASKVTGVGGANKVKPNVSAAPRPGSMEAKFRG